MSELQIFFFVVLGVLLTGYAILDGFDLGVGILHLAARGDQERRVMMNSIGPLWDGNGVWLVTFGGALFAAFPDVYATVFSGFYTAFMIVLFALILRAVSIEFRSKETWLWWRQMWDVAFSLASATATFVFGVAVGNSIQGIPIGADKEFVGGFATLLHPYPIVVGLLAVSTFAMHGAIFLTLKTDGALRDRAHRWSWNGFGFFLIFFLLTTMFTLARIPAAWHNFETIPGAWIVVLLNVLAIANIPRALYLSKPGYAFISSCCAIAALNIIFGMALFPNLVTSSLNPDWSLSVYNSSSSLKTLQIMQRVVFLGMPFVLTYTAVVYWVFRGRVNVSKLTY